jgi:hypothetical protein
MPAKPRSVSFSVCLCATAAVLVGACCGRAALAAAPDKDAVEVGLRFRPLRSVLYSRAIQRNVKLIGGLDQLQKIRGAGGRRLDAKTVDKDGWLTPADGEIVHLQFDSQEGDVPLAWVMEVGEYIPGTIALPSHEQLVVDSVYPLVGLGSQGVAGMFGRQPASLIGPRTPAVLYIHRRVPIWRVPVFPADRSKVALGKEWTVHVPPPVYYPSHVVKPPVDRVILKQKWEETVKLGWYRCAKISFEYKHRWKGNQKDLKQLLDIADAMETSSSLKSAGEPLKKGEMPNWYLKWTGVVYFAIEGGIVVMEQSNVELSCDPYLDVFRQNTRLLHATWLGRAAERQLKKQPRWNYRFQKYHSKSEYQVAFDASEDIRADMKVVFEAIKTYKVKHGVLPKTLQDIKGYPNVTEVKWESLRYEGRELTVTNENDRCVLWVPIAGHPKWVLIGYPSSGTYLFGAWEAKFLDVPGKKVEE